MYMYIMLAMCTPGALSLGQNGQISIRKAGNLIYVLAKSFKIVFVRKHVSQQTGTVASVIINTEMDPSANMDKIEFNLSPEMACTMTQIFLA